MTPTFSKIVSLDWSFTDQLPHATSESQSRLKHWRCNKCGHKFDVGETFRWVAMTHRQPALTNILVCPECDDDDDHLYAWWLDWNNRYGWMFEER